MLRPRPQVVLPVTSAIFFIDEEPPVVLNEGDRDACRGAVAAIIGKLLAGHSVKALAETQHCFPLDVVAETKNYRVLRLPENMIRDLPHALQDLAEELAAKIKDKPGKYAVEVGSNDAKNNTDNQWGDWLYIYGRVVPSKVG